MKSNRDRLKVKCVYFNGTINKKCKAGIEYTEQLHELSCIGRSKNCVKYRPHTDKEINEIEARTKNTIRCMVAGISECCHALIDESHVIKEGSYKGHGIRFCSECKKVLFIV